MERKTGEIFEYNGEWHQCIEDENKSCGQCDLSNLCPYNRDLADNVGNCSKNNRSDGKSIIFKKLEKVGEPFSCNFYEDRKLVIMQEYQLYEANAIYNYGSPPMYISDYKHKRIAIEIKQTKENMKEKKQKLDKLVDDYKACRIQYAEFDKGIKALYDKEESEPTLKEFDLETAKSGKPVCTRDGRRARIICFDRDWDMQIVALVADPLGESVHYYLSNGKVDFDKQNDEDLMMLPEKKEGWAVISRNDIYETEEKAKEVLLDSRIGVMIRKVEWEE